MSPTRSQIEIEQMNLADIEIEDASTGLMHACPEDPTKLAGAPLGMYHCPWCGCMQVAGLHHVHEFGCWLGLWPAAVPMEDGE